MFKIESEKSKHYLTSLKIRGGCGWMNLVAAFTGHEHTHTPRLSELGGAEEHLQRLLPAEKKGGADDRDEAPAAIKSTGRTRLEIGRKKKLIGRRTRLKIKLDLPVSWPLAAISRRRFLHPSSISARRPFPGADFFADSFIRSPSAFADGSQIREGAGEGNGFRWVRSD